MFLFFHTVCFYETDLAGPTKRPCVEIMITAKEAGREKERLGGLV